uniref:Secreted protein n=1 Tax=Romanomermis culicivorax TaxID=13658 RepID=A0A915K6N2_ROMCU
MSTRTMLIVAAATLLNSSRSDGVTLEASILPYLFINNACRGQKTKLANCTHIMHRRFGVALEVHVGYDVRSHTTGFCIRFAPVNAGIFFPDAQYGQNSKKQCGHSSLTKKAR